MTQTPEFDTPKKFGINTAKLPQEPGDIHITAGAEVSLRYKGKCAIIRVTKVIQPQSEFEGMLESFEGNELEHDGLKYGDEVHFAYDKIEHIYKWIEADQP